MQQRGLRWLNIGRWWLCGTGLFVAAPLVPEMIRNYRKWHAALGSDPSVADFWRTAFYLGLARFAMEIILVAAIFFILKPRPGMFGIRTNSEPSARAKNDAMGEK
jgi:hypothetical protein